MLLNTYGPLIEAFRGDDLPRRHSRNLLSGIHVFAFSLVLNTYGLLINTLRGDEKGEIEPFRGDGQGRSLRASYSRMAWQSRVFYSI